MGYLAEKKQFTSHEINNKMSFYNWVLALTKPLHIGIGSQKWEQIVRACSHFLPFPC